MKLFVSNTRVVAVLGLLSLVLMLSACSTSSTNGGGTAPVISGSTATATATTTTSSTTGSSSTGSTGSSSQGTVTYASVEISILSIDQENKFSDDSGSGAWILRANIKEHNTSDTTAFVFYSDSMRLILPNAKSIAPGSEQNGGGVDQGVVRNNWVDFPLDTKQDVSKLILRIGTATENQMDVPLSQNPNLSKYQSKTSTFATKLQYGGVDWTVTKLISSLSYKGKQATAGHHYVTVEMTADNSTANEFFPFPSDNFRLKSQNETQAPNDSTLPSSIAANSQGTTGTVTFLMPQNDTALTLMFLAQSASKIDAASADFKI